MRKLLSSLVAVVLLVAVPACGGDDDGPMEPATPTLDGSWTGTNDGATFQLTLNEAEDGSVTGGGNVSSDAESASLDVTGTHVHPDVTLQMTSTGFADVNFSGELATDDRMVGELSGSGFSGDAITFDRQ